MRFNLTLLCEDAVLMAKLAVLFHDSPLAVVIDSESLVYCSSELQYFIYTDLEQYAGA